MPLQSGAYGQPSEMCTSRAATAHRSPARIRPAPAVPRATAANVPVGCPDDRVPVNHSRPIRRLPDGLAPSAGPAREEDP